MKKFHLLLLLIPLTLIACSTEEAEKLADEYHKKLQAEQDEYIVDHLVDPEQLSLDGRDAWLGLFDLVHSWGKITNVTKSMGFHKNYNNGVTTVDLDYELEFEPRLTVQEKISLIDRGDGYKVWGVEYN